MAYCAAASAAPAVYWTRVLKGLGRTHCTIPLTNPGISPSLHERLGLTHIGIPLTRTGVSPSSHGGTHFLFSLYCLR